MQLLWAWGSPHAVQLTGSWATYATALLDADFWLQMSRGAGFVSWDR
jgi:hypothetical protein